MPATKKPRRGSLANEHTALTAPLGENERLLELIIYAEVCGAAELPLTADSLLDRLLVRVQLADEVKVVAPLAQSERDVAVSTMPGGSDVATTRCIQATLLAKRVTLSGALLESLCGEQAQHQVTLHLPPAMVVGTTAVAEAPAQTIPGLRGERTNPRVEKGQSQVPVTSPPQSRQERIRSARGARREVSLVCGECIAQAAVSLLDVLVEQRSYRYELTPVPAPQGLERCWVELRCSDMPLLQPRRLLEVFRPVCLTLESVDALPIPRQCHAESGDVVAELELEVGLLGMVRRTRFRQPDTKAQGCIWRTLLLLLDASPLAVYQHLLLDRVTLTLYSVGAERALIGTGAFSLCTYLTHGQTSFSERVQLLPRRATVTSVEESCLTAGCTASVVVDFFVLYPLLRHVDESGAAVTRRFLTRAVLILPYCDDDEARPWVARALACLIAELRRLPVARAGEGETHLYIEPDPPPPQTAGAVEGDDAVDGGPSGLVGANNTSAATPVASGDGDDDPSDSADDDNQSDDSESDNETAKEDERGRRDPRAPQGLRQRAKLPPPPTTQQRAAGAPRSVSPPPDHPADPPTPFERPFCVVSPAGISGFEVIDAAQRIVCLEGPVADLHHVLQTVADAAGHPSSLRLLFNAELFLPRRQYITFPPLITPPPPPIAVGQAEEGGMAAQTSRGGGGARRSRSRPSSASRPLPLPAGGHGGGKEPSAAESGVAALGVAPPSRTTPRARPGQQGEVDTSAALCVAVPPQADDGTATEEEDVSKGDAEASGTGGRLHRVRLRETLTSIALQPRYLLRRALSEACLHCLQQLYTLQRCTTMREAVNRDCFPSAADIISVERSFGQTLELVDLYGEATPSRPSPAATTGIALPVSQREPSATTALLPSTPPPPPPPPDVDRVRADKLQPEDVGKLTSFVGYLYTAKPRRVPRCVREHYPITAWMQTVEGGLVLCAFSEAMPGRTIRYHVEGQVTRWQATLLLYVLAARSLAVSQTSSTNAEFEARLRQRARAVRDEVTMRLTQQLHPSVVTQRSTAATTTHAVLASATPTTPVKGTATRTRGGDDDSEDDNAQASWPVVPEHISAQAGLDALRTACRGQNDLVDSTDPSGVHGTRTSRMLAAMHKQKQRQAREAEYALWWSLYNQRAPKTIEHTRDVTRHVFHF